MSSSLPFPEAGSILITGPSNVGKTRLTYRALAAWVDRAGPDGVVVFDFAPELERDGRLLGGRLDRFGPLPEGAWVGQLDARAPRAEGETDEASIALARENAEAAARLFAAAPSGCRAVFVNDATIPFQHEAADCERLTRYADRATYVVANAFESDELGTADPVSRNERRALETLRAWADRVVELRGDDAAPGMDNP